MLRFIEGSPASLFLMETDATFRNRALLIQRNI
jgi:hypothetical protein